MISSTENVIGAKNDRNDRAVIAIMPSAGLGGGIEAYCSAVLQAIEATEAVERLTLLSAAAPDSKVAKARICVRALRCGLRHRRSGTRQLLVLSFHPALIPLAVLVGMAAGKARTRSLSVFHGADIWNASRLQQRLWSHVVTEAVTVSSYGAGWLSSLGLRSVSVVSPTVSEDRYRALLALPSVRSESDCWTILSVFRLESFEEKGGPALIDAVKALRREGRNAELVIAGIAASSAKVRQLLASVTQENRWIRIVENASDRDLVDLYREADVFVLATRSSHGEGFGIVLAEAALAALPTVPPVSGGSADAFVQGWTGIRPSDESSDALAEVLRLLHESQGLRMTLGQHGRAWAIWRFDPSSYVQQVRRSFLCWPR